MDQPDRKFDKKKGGYVIAKNKYDFDVGETKGRAWTGPKSEISWNLKTLAANAIAVLTQGTGIDCMIHFSGAVSPNKSSK